MQVDVLIVGAGPAGIGCGLALRRAGVEKVLVLEADRVGSSFDRWPEEMRLITPSFHGNPFFQTDLNAVTPDTSPADLFQKEHLGGREYAEYLRALVAHFGLKTHENERVLRIQPDDGGFRVDTKRACHPAKAVIWSGGEFALPRHKAFSGAELCAHSSLFRSWTDFRGEDALIIGGSESGIDAACHLARMGKRVLLLSSGEPWKADDPDPSETLSPFTRKRLKDTLCACPGRLALRGHSAVTGVAKLSGRYVVETADGEVFESLHRPINATGFHSALTPVKKFFAWEGSVPRFTDEDESTLYPGFYYSGPSLVQRSSKFCFIYKFRARFGVIARSLARRLGYPEPDMEDDRRRGFLIDDLECCTHCECALEPEDATANARS